jgi:hypothetical protein
MIDGGNGLTSWFFCLRKKQAYHVWGPLPLYSLTQLAESKVKSHREKEETGFNFNARF